VGFGAVIGYPGAILKALGTIVPSLLLPFVFFVVVVWWCGAFPRRNIAFDPDSLTFGCFKHKGLASFGFLQSRFAVLIFWGGIGYCAKFSFERFDLAGEIFSQCFEVFNRLHHGFNRFLVVMQVCDKSSNIMSDWSIISRKERFHRELILIKSVMHVTDIINEVKQGFAVFVIFEWSLFVLAKVGCGIAIRVVSKPLRAMGETLSYKGLPLVMELGGCKMFVYRFE